MSLVKGVKVSNYLSPRYWPTWLALGLMRVVAKLPLPLLVILGKALGRLLYILLPKRRKIADINLSIAFPTLDAANRQRMIKTSFDNVGIAAFEVGLSWWEHDKLLHLCEIEGLEYLQAAIKQGNGVIILTAHFTCLEIGGPVLNHHVPFQVMYKRAHNELFDAFMKYHRGRLYKAIVDHHQPRMLIKGLKQGYAAWYAPDQDFSGKDTLFLPFFGVEATALTAPARMAKIANAPVIPYYIERKSSNRGYRLVIQPALEQFPTDDAEADARRINDTLEQLIMQNPEQYLWLHKRYKNRPPDAQPIYPK